MGEDQKIHLDHLKEVQLEHTNLRFDYCRSFSDFGTWQFWVTGTNETSKAKLDGNVGNTLLDKTSNYDQHQCWFTNRH